MWELLEELWERLGHHSGPKAKRIFTRNFVVSEQAAAWVIARPRAEQLAFADLLLRLDGDPFEHSKPELRPGAAPGMRYAPFDAHQALLVWNPAENSIHILLCH